MRRQAFAFATTLDIGSKGYDMASIEHISDSESESQSLSQDQSARIAHTPTPETHDVDLSPPHSTLSHRFRPSPEKARGSRDGSAIAIEVPPPINRSEYQAFTGNTTVDYILEDFEDSGGVRYYRVEFEDGNQDEVSRIAVLHISLLPIIVKIEFVFALDSEHAKVGFVLGRNCSRVPLYENIHFLHSLS